MTIESSSSTVNNLVIALMFVVPGFVALSIRGLLNGYRKRSAFEFLYQSIIISLLINLFFVLLPINAISVFMTAPSHILSRAMQLATYEILVAFVVGIVMTAWSRIRVGNSTFEEYFFTLFRKARLTDSMDALHVWNGVCVDMTKDNNVSVLLPGGIVVTGQMEYMSDDPLLREITLTDVTFVEASTGKHLDSFSKGQKLYLDLGQTSGLLYKHNKLARLEVTE